MMNKNLLEVKNVSKTFKINKKQIIRAVDNVSFNVKTGETLGLVGESGCGKTTIGRTIIRLHQPDSGEVLFKGAKIHGVSKAQHKNLTRSMQMIYQDPYASLNPFFTIGEIISEGLEIHKLYDGSKENQKRVYELLEMVGLHKSHINRFPHEFSGGQRQRVGIARALAVNPEFIICDEAISALDVSIQAQIINLLIDLQKNLNLTYLFIAHDLAMVRHISDNTAVMYLGSLVEIGETDAVYKNPLHPYTKGLIDAVPVADPEYEANRVKSNIKGEISNLTNLPDGCRFYPRCEVANEVCKHKNPVLREIYNGHYVACHYYNEV